MSKSSLYMSVALACAGSWLPTAAMAAKPTSASGILLMGFRVDNAPNETTSIVVNIGAAATYRDATGPITITNINADLVTTYGSDWMNRPDLHWGLGGCPSISTATTTGAMTDPANTLYVSRVEDAEGTPESPLTVFETSVQRRLVAANFNNLLGIGTPGAGISGGFDDATASSNNSFLAFESNSYANSWRSFLAPGGISAGTTGTIDFGWDTKGIQAAGTQTLSLLRYATNTPTYEGSFKIESNGDVTFTPNLQLSYASWAATNAGGQAANLDFDGDGISNGVEYFMGTAGNSFTPNPKVVNGVITWTRAANIVTPTSVKVQTSTNLTSWDDVMTGLQNGTGNIQYTLPTGASKLFVRLNVAQ